MGFIYGLVCPVSGHIRYVGQTRSKSVKERLGDHLRESFYIKDVYTHKERWIRKVHSDREPVTIVILEEAADTDLNRLECSWMEVFERLTNSTSGGTSGYIFTDEVRRRLSDQKKGASNPMWGRKYKPSPEHANAISEGLRGSEKLKTSRSSPQYRKKISDIQSVNVWVVLSYDGKIIDRFSNARQTTDFFSKLLGRAMTVGNVKNARRFSRPVGKQLDSWFYVAYEQDVGDLQRSIDMNTKGKVKIGDDKAIDPR